MKRGLIAGLAGTRSPAGPFLSAPGRKPLLFEGCERQIERTSWLCGNRASPRRAMSPSCCPMDRNWR